MSHCKSTRKDIEKQNENQQHLPQDNDRSKFQLPPSFEDTSFLIIRSRSHHHQLVKIMKGCLKQGMGIHVYLSIKATLPCSCQFCLWCLIILLLCPFLSNRNFLLDLITLFTFYRELKPFRVLCISSIKAARMLFASQANMPLVFWCSKFNVYRFI